MNRPKSTGRNLPPRMLPRVRTLKSGEVWVGYYYNGRDDAGKRKEIPLGTDLAEAKRKWAELEHVPPPAESGTMAVAFNRYELEVIPKKAPKTQVLNLAELENLRAVFASAPFKAVLPKHIAGYRDNRKTKRRLRKDGTVRDPGGKPAPVAANRELALFSDIWNMAREWGYTDRENPCRGVSKNEETPRDFYADPEVWAAVRSQAPQELKDAMDLAYLSGQRPDDVCGFTVKHIIDDALTAKQGKTGKRLRIDLTDRETGVRTELGQLIDRIKARSVRTLALLATPEGKPLTRHMLRTRFEDARAAALAQALAAKDADLAARIKQFQFRDVRPKAASEIEDIAQAQKLLGHTKEQITRTVYRRVGERVKPTK
ncbi:tyrosine-type recombinase/integrase [Paucibacter sp. APW11]|uniref:Tyrosine-type recombinase/integrase n=1 Tax=Roseateles aquae TaxID=3077235 RepID=A0ABU3P768_9BURK|nr:tyrosine-type recombinase/integrase [Paucibacter sp. APW11]MDT8998384.1 tyrosine-type recombinase/integrase [Paucibacter sp. APW11]